MNNYETGNLVTITATFTNLSGAPADPSTVTLKVQDPEGVETVYTYALGEITRTGVGAYSIAVAVAKAGFWTYRWEGTGTVYAAQEARFNVDGSIFG